jgi:hypothetical protein
MQRQYRLLAQFVGQRTSPPWITNSGWSKVLVCRTAVARVASRHVKPSQLDPAIGGAAHIGRSITGCSTPG